MEDNIKLDRVERMHSRISGTEKFLVVVDDEDRENEGRPHHSG